MAKTVDVASGQMIASAWGNEVRDRTSQLFASTSERDSQWAGASSLVPVGASCITTDTGMRWQKVGTAWVPAMGTVPSFASTAARDSAWPNPPNGAQCITTDTNTQWQRINGVWTVGTRSGLTHICRIGNQSIPLATWTQLTWTKTRVNNGVSTSAASNTGISTLVSGTFLVTANICWQPGGGTARYVRISNVNNGWVFLWSVQHNTASGVGIDQVVSGALHLAQGETITVWVYHDLSPGPLNIIGGDGAELTQLSVTYLGSDTFIS